MRTRIWITLSICLVFILSTVWAAVPGVQAAGRAAPTSFMPADPDKIGAMLVKQGLIPANASPEQKDAAIQAYLQKKMSGGGEDKGYNPLARKQVDNNEEALNSIASSDINGRKLGNTANVDPSAPQFKPVDKAGKLLLILVEFSNTPYTWTTAEGTRTETGPLHNEIPVPDNSFDLFVPDFSTQHYEDMLFTPGGWKFPSDAPRYANEHRGSMHDYYLEQSYGQYTVNGKAYGWFTVDKPEAYYGDDRVTGGNDNLLPGTTEDLIADAVSVVNAQNAIPWEEYDTNGDCIIDHPLFIHAGIDQSGGGGAQKNDAIWAHSASVWQQVATTTACPKGLYIYNYTIMPEDGGVGVFAHEFGHDLGLPDEYDTIYSGRGDSVAFWSLMSSGSWVGKPAQTQPANISIWGKYALGWMGDNLAITSVKDLSKNGMSIRLEQAERWGGDGTFNGIRINLPQKLLYVNSPHSGGLEWFGGKADQLDTTLRRAVDLTGKSSAALSFWTWYDTEQNWDYGFVQVSTDGGDTWTSLAMAGTSSDIDPGGMGSIAANLPGFTGNSGGWVLKTADLSAYAGKSILLQFRYMTDWATSLAGFYVDDISITADGTPVFTDDVETLAPGWTPEGWTREAGSSWKNQYYMLELRNSQAMETPYDGTTIVNFDNGLSDVYNFDPYSLTPNEPDWFAYQPGVLLWYRDMAYTDNWTGVHPGSGFLLVVDAHKQPMLRPPLPKSGSLPWSSRVQSYDAAFGLDKIPDMLLSYWGIIRNYAGGNAVPNFDDSISYWSSKAPAASVQTMTYGVKFRVLGEAEDGSAVVIGLGLK